MKSQVTEDLELVICIYNDAMAKCSVKSAPLDLKTLRSRVKNEGKQFLTITLPQYLSDFERSLEDMRIDSKYFRSFRKYRSIPAFLRGMISLVFDNDTGLLLQHPDVSAIEGIRQVTGAFKKQKLLCSDKKIVRAMDQFVKDEEIFDEPISESDIRQFKSISDWVWSGFFSDYHSYEDAVPHHGPGATCERIYSNYKYVHKTWYDRLEPYFPLLGNAFCNENASEHEDFEQVTIVSEEEESPVRVIPVPKTQKSPRVIAIEPVCMQYIQQGLSRYIIRKIESSEKTTGHINFSDQSVNGSIAISTSRNGRFATLDLSSASDRVPCDLALYMFRSNPVLMDSIYACRSRTAELPDGRIVHLRKFASMGSALCFPIEAMYFYTICVKAILEAYNWPVTRKYVRQARRRVYVYGDDIIIPTDCTDSVVDNLQKYYCKVNVTKSFSKSHFRESCGTDAWNGHIVNVTYVRTERPKRRTDSQEIISYVATSNLFYKKGYWQTATYMKDVVERVIGKLPIVEDNCCGLGWSTYQKCEKQSGRWNKDLQRFEVKTYVVVPRYRRNPISNYAALTKCLLSLCEREDAVCTKQDHLVKTERRGSVTLKTRWVSPH